MGANLGWAASKDGGEAPVAAALEGTASLRNTVSVGLPIGEFVVGNRSRVKHLLEG